MSQEPTLTLSEILSIARDHIADAKQLAALQAELFKTAKENAAAKAAEKEAGAGRTKTRLVAFIRSDSPAVKQAAQAGVWLCSVPDDDTTATYSGLSLIQRLRKAAAEHNETKPRRRGKPRTKLETWFQLFQLLKAATLKASGSAITLKQKGTPAELVVLEHEAIAEGAQ